MGRPKGSKNKTITITASEPKPKKQKVNWEVLAKQLQQALASEIKENDGLKKEVERLRISVIKMGGVIEFLEIKRGNNPV